MSIEGRSFFFWINASAKGRERKWPEATWIDFVAWSIASTSASATVSAPVVLKTAPFTVNSRSRRGAGFPALCVEHAYLTRVNTSAGSPGSKLRGTTSF